MDIYDKANQIKSQQDFISFLKLLSENLKNDSSDWDNDSLDTFLEGLHGYCGDIEVTNPDWKTFAQVLLAARVYE